MTGKVGQGIEVKPAAVGTIVDDPTWSHKDNLIETERSGPFRIVEVDQLCGPFVSVPFFKLRATTRRGQHSATIGHFKAGGTKKFRIKVPVTMLKLRNPICNSKLDQGASAKDAPSCAPWKVLFDNEDMTPLLEDQRTHLSEEECSSVRKDLSIEDFAFLRYLQELANDKGIKDTESKLSPPPNEIRDTFRSVLGDAWHYMDRARVPIKHKFRKAYFVALSEAWFAWEPVALEQVKDAMRREGMTDKDIERKM